MTKDNRYYKVLVILVSYPYTHTHTHISIYIYIYKIILYQPRYYDGVVACDHSVLPL
jgi:hypothetical protein